MRNDVKPVTPRPDHAYDAPETPSPRKGRAEADFDDMRATGRRHERGDEVDPVGPKPTSRYGNDTVGGVTTGPASTTGPVSHSNDRLERTTGKLRDRDTERSARAGEGPDLALAIPTGDSSFGVPVLMAVLALIIALLGLALFLNWGNATPTATTPTTPPAGGADAPVVVTEE